MSESNFDNLPKLLIYAGGALLAIGLVLFLLKGKISLGWIGNLPGDIRIERENFRFYFPITTMILLSLLVNVVLRLWRYFQ